LLIITSQLKRLSNNNFFELLHKVISLPLDLFFFLLIIVIPVLCTHLFIYVFIALAFLIPMMLYRLDQAFDILSLKYETWVYIILTTGGITLILLNKQIEKLTFRLIPFLVRKTEKLKRFKIVELCTYIASRDNIKIIIYFMFFITLIAFNVLSLQANSYFDNPNVDKAIIQFFITFIAFDRILSSIKFSEFRPSKLLEIYKSAIFNEAKNFTEDNDD